MLPSRSVGIDSIGVAFPAQYLELADLAEARGVAPSKFVDGLGIRRMAVPAQDEDTVTLAARAAREALQHASSSGEDVGLLAVGTETAVDHSKPVASFVQGLLGLPRAMRVFETKHACYGGTAALQLALDWIRSGSARGKKALVICSDIARYGVRTAGEPTQGAGAVALLLSENPRILQLDAGQSGVFAQDVNDFWRPLYSKDAVVDGHYSVKCYLEALEGAYRDYQSLTGPASEGFFSDRFAALAYHVPYGKMAVKAHRHLRGLDGDPTPEASFDRLVGASLRFPSEIGNVYTGSLYLALTSLLATSGTELEGQRVGLFSYGSGSCAEFFSGTVCAGAIARMQSLRIAERLAARRKLTVDEYEAIMAARERMDSRAPEAAAPAPFQYLGVEEHRRTYGPGLS